MSYDRQGRFSRPGSSGGQSSFGQRQRFGGNRRFSGRRPPTSNISHSKYINKAVAEKEEVQIATRHTFEDFGFHTQLMKNIVQHGYEKPTPIQDQAIPEMMLGRDLIGIANTGTGKTAAFLIPLIERMAQDNEEGALIVVPTRELAVQIADEFTQLAHNLRLGMMLCVGGTSIGPQIHGLKRNPHVVIGTPGRLKDLIQRNFLRTHMFTNIVLDEVDRMLDIGFIHDVKFLIAQLPEERKSYFFSATMNREAEDIAHTFLKQPVKVSVRTRETSEHIHQDIVRIEEGKSKVDVLYELLTQPEFERVIVFGRTKHGINKLEETLSQRGLRVSSIHGNKTQGARQRSLDLFKKGRVQALLATDVAARGIDIQGVSHVINFDEPGTYEDYIHRIGRTGRAGKSGKALTFVS